MKKDTDHEIIDGAGIETKVSSKKRSKSKSPSRRKRSKSRDKGERRKRSRSRSKDRRSHRRGSRSKSRERRRRSRSREKGSSKKSSRHRSKSRDRERSERKRSRSKERSRDSRSNYSKDGRSLREKTPEHKGVTRDYDQEEAGFESNGDVKRVHKHPNIEDYFQDKIDTSSTNLLLLKSTLEDSGFSNNSNNYGRYNESSNKLLLNQAIKEGNASQQNILNSSQIPDLLSSSNVVGAELGVGYEELRVTDINLTNQYNNMKYYNGGGKKMDKENHRCSSRDPRLMKSNMISTPVKFEDQDHHNYNGKSRDSRLITVNEDTREAMGTEDMEISNSP